MFYVQVNLIHINPYLHSYNADWVCSLPDVMNMDATLWPVTNVHNIHKIWSHSESPAHAIEEWQF